MSGYQDYHCARKRCIDRLCAEEHAELMARLQRIPVIRAWNYVTSGIFRFVSLHSDRLSQITHTYDDLLSAKTRR